MRSETGVLPASMWAAIPMLRILVMSRGINLFLLVRSAEADPTKSSNTKPAGSTAAIVATAVPGFRESAPAGLLSFSSSIGRTELRLSLAEAQFPTGAVLILTRQGFGQHEPLIWLDLHGC